MEEGVKLEIRQMVRETMSTIANPDDESDLEKRLRTLASLLPGVKTPSGDVYGVEATWLAEAKAEFLTSHYSRFLECLVEHLTVDWMNKITKGQSGVTVDVFFLKGEPLEAFTVLTTAISQNRPSYQLNKCVSLMETFLAQHQLGELLWSQCQVKGDGATRVDPYTQQMWHKLTTLIANLPDHVTSKLQQETSEIFYPDQYITFISNEILSVLKKVYEHLKTSQDCSVQFLGHLVGKLCIVGYGDKLWSILLPPVSKLISHDFLWSRVCERLLVNVPDRSLESAVIPIIKQSAWHGTISRLFGNAVLTSAKLQYLLTHKLVLLKHYKQDVVLQNIIGYLATSASRHHLHIKMLKMLLEVWGDVSALKHTSYEQHQYITRAILVCLAFLDEKEAKELKNDCLKILMPGVQAHLDSPLPNVRRLGMIVAESVTHKLDSQNQPLQFEYERDGEVEHLLSLLVPPENPGTGELHSDFSAVSLQEKNESVPTDQANTLPTQDADSQAASDLDSDDDLEPYDMSNDVKVSKVKTPVYLRDCMEGLISSDDPDRMQACLLVAEKLIRGHPASVKEISAEFTKVLLHVQDSFSVSGFLGLRHGAMVSLAVTAPEQVTEYLTAQFYERNYNLRQRMDILQVLGAAAKELSQPIDSAPKATPGSVSNKLKVNPHEPEVEMENWREIVQRRIESKTRRFGRGRSKPEPQGTANRFAPVAGLFFFPLMKNFDRRENTLDLLGDDHLVLGRLVYTLGIILHSAANAPIVRQMASAMLEFIWVLRYHPQPGVRQALLFAMSMTVLSTPGYILLSDLQTEILEAKGWLQDVFEKDADTECKKMAAQALMLLEHNIKQEFETEPS